MKIQKIGVLSPGDMGQAVAGRLKATGRDVYTALEGRSERTAALAKEAGLTDAGSVRNVVQTCDAVLSVLNPAAALDKAREVADAIRETGRSILYVDCNAIAPQTVHEIDALIRAAGGVFVDGGIIGGPPRPGYSPAIYASGPAVGERAVLRDWGIDWRCIGGPIGAASGLKMSYAGITKGITALGSAMMLGAARFGCAEALLAELRSSQPDICKYLSASIPRMYDKAYRWVAEMEEISDFHGAYKPAADIYAAIARHYEALAAAEAATSPAPDNPIKTLDRVLGR